MSPEEIAMEEITGEEPTGEEPTGEEPTGEEPTGEEPTGEEPTGDEITGTVKWYNPARAYGFIARDNGEGDVFVHRSALDEVPLSTLREGDRVRFSVEVSPKGPRAENVRLIS